MTDQIHQISGIFTVMNRKRAIKTDLIGIVTQETRTDPMKGAGPLQRVCHDTSTVTDSRFVRNGSVTNEDQSVGSRLAVCDDLIRQASLGCQQMRGMKAWVRR